MHNNNRTQIYDAIGYLSTAAAMIEHECYEAASGKIGQAIAALLTYLASDIPAADN